jgi:hypothetical protein
VAKACLFLPCSDGDLKTVARLADLPVTFGIGDKGAMPYFQICKALSEYRQGHYAQALEWGQKTLGSLTVASHAHASAIVAWRRTRKGRAIIRARRSAGKPRVACAPHLPAAAP